LFAAMVRSEFPQFEFVQAQRLSDALSAVVDARVRCVVLDLSLPDAHGLETLDAVRNAAPAAPIVVLTGQDEELGTVALARGAQDYLTKGNVDRHTLARALRYAMERQRAEAELVYQALHDPVTGLPNRRLLLERVNRAALRTARRDDRAAVLFLDLDGFKPVNDTLGHGYGDLLLAAFGQRLREAVRPEDTVARVGGDEFMVLCEGLASDTDALEVAGRLHHALQTPFSIGEQEWTITASIGVAVAHHGKPVGHDLVRDADVAMYRAKERGRAQTELFDDRVRRRLEERVTLAQRLRRAVADGAFGVAFQPIVDVASGTIVGAEALARWNLPDGTPVPPAEFIPLAEETGLIRPLGRAILEESCRAAARWRALYDPTFFVSVNLSAQQLTDRDLVDYVTHAFEDVGLDPGGLCLEITESSVMEDAEATGSVLRRLDRLGVTLGVDDFGTGYSSLVYLRRFPLTLLKIDQSFVDGLGRNSEDEVIVSALLGLGGALGHRVVAEGVETPRQRDLLQGLGCRYAQGFLFGVPATVPEFELYLTAARRAGSRAPGALAGPSASMTLATPPSAPGEASAELHVLVVEDSRSDRRLIERNLRSCYLPPIGVTHVDHLAAALDELRRRRFDVVLLDLGLPDADGLEGLAGLRRQAADVPIVVLTVNEDSGLDQAAIQAGAEDYLPKSDLNPRALARAVRYAVERRGLAVERQALARRQRDFLATAVHELRNPLSALVGASKTIAEQHERIPDAARQELFRILERQSDRCASLANDLLDLTRFDSGADEPELDRIELAPVVEDVLETLPAPDGFTLEVHVPSRLWVLAHRRRLEQVLTNLVTNAYKYGTSHVAVRAARRGRRVTLSVSDDGPGVPDDLVDRLFEPFTRGRNVAQREGAGLGLAIAQTAATSMGGSLKYVPASRAFVMELDVPPVPVVRKGSVRA
jgi:diguanylate cyclase (GGDEF)-like protein